MIIAGNNASTPWNLSETKIWDHLEHHILKDITKPQLPSFTSKQKCLQKLRMCLFYSVFYASNTTSISGYCILLLSIYTSICMNCSYVTWKRRCLELKWIVQAQVSYKKLNAVLDTWLEYVEPLMTWGLFGLSGVMHQLSYGTDHL